MVGFFYGLSVQIRRRFTLRRCCLWFGVESLYVVVSAKLSFDTLQFLENLSLVRRRVTLRRLDFGYLLM